MNINMSCLVYNERLHSTLGPESTAGWFAMLLEREERTNLFYASATSACGNEHGDAPIEYRDRYGF